jgi:hypothetical protein
MTCNRCANQAEAALRATGVPARQTQAAWASDEAAPSRCEECGRFLSPRVSRCLNPGCGKETGQVVAPQGSPADADAAPLFTADDVIYTYTRAQAIEDGVLVDVSETAREAGFRWPVALTAGVWALIEDIPPRFQGLQDIQGRLWDTLWMARLAARRGGVETHYELILHHGRKTYATLKLVSGPGDQGEPVITIMLPDED